MYFPGGKDCSSSLLIPFITATCSISLVSDCVAEDTDVSICILCDKMFEDDGFEVGE